MSFPEIAWSSIPTHVLLTELSRRDDDDERPQCGSGEQGSYDTGLHVFALFLILIVSTLGTDSSLFLTFLLEQFNWPASFLKLLASTVISLQRERGRRSISCFRRDHACRAYTC